MAEMRLKQMLIDKLTHEMAALKRLKFAAASEAYTGERQQLLFETIETDLDKKIEPLLVSQEEKDLCQKLMALGKDYSASQPVWRCVPLSSPFRQCAPRRPLHGSLRPPDLASGSDPVFLDWRRPDGVSQGWV